MAWIAPVASGLLGFGGNLIGGKDAANSANQALDQQTSEFNAIQKIVNEVMGMATDQYNQYDVPAMNQVFPNMEQTLAGGPSPMMEAAQAPVMAQTARNINQIKSMLGGVTNPNALIQDVSQTGQQNAALAGDQTIGSSLSGLINLISQGTNFLQNAGSSGEYALSGIANSLGQRAAGYQGTNYGGIGQGLGSVLGALFGPGGPLGQKAGSTTSPGTMVSGGPYGSTENTTPMPMPNYVLPSVGISQPSIPTIDQYDFPAPTPGPLPGMNSTWTGDFNPSPSALPSWMNVLPGASMPPAS